VGHWSQILEVSVKGWYNDPIIAKAQHKVSAP
jgi:hypothetical protein